VVAHFFGFPEKFPEIQTTILRRREMKRFLTMFLAVTVLLALSAPAWAFTDTSDLWDIKQGNVVTSNGPTYPGSDNRNMFGGEFGTIEVASTIFWDTATHYPGYVDWVSWKTPTAIDLGRFILSVAADGSYPTSYNRAIQGFNLYASNTDLAFYSDWGVPIYSSGYLAPPLGHYINGIYYYTIDHTFTDSISAQYFKADIVHGSYTTGPRIIELDGYGSPVPLPGAVWLLGSGLAGLIAARRKKKA
jgi:hypothetical protein